MRIKEWLAPEEPDRIHLTAVMIEKSGNLVDCKDFVEAAALFQHVSGETERTPAVAFMCQIKICHIRFHFSGIGTSGAACRHIYGIPALEIPLLDVIDVLIGLTDHS